MSTSVNLSIDKKKVPRYLLIVFILITVASISLVYYYYETQKAQIRKSIENELVAIADLKAAQIVNWRKERLGDAATIISNSFIVPDIHRFMESSNAPGLRLRIMRWMKSFKKSDQYDNIFLFDTKGRLRISVGDKLHGLVPSMKRLVFEALNSRVGRFSELQLSAELEKTHQDLVVPLISDETDNAVPVGVIIMQVNPDDFVFPLLRSWPTPSATAETMFVRPLGNEFVFLSSRRNAAVTLYRLSVGDSARLSAFTDRVEKNVFEAKDYRGVNVLAVTKAIKDSPWHIVAKVDTDEIFAPISELGWRLAFIIIGLLLSAAGSIALIWRHQSAMYYREQYESELNRVALLRHYEPLTRHANDSILLFDAEGNILEANERSSSMLGYALEELLHMNVRSIGTACALLDMDELGKKLNVSEEKGLVFESEYLRKEGTVFPVEVSLRAFEIEGRTFFQAIIRDITERKKSELRIGAMNSLLKLFMKKTSRQEYLAAVVGLMRMWSGCDSTGIRMLNSNGCMQYESHMGFSRGFLDSENLLSATDHQCACVRVMLGRRDGQDAGYMTQHGSFRCDDLEELLKGLSEEDRGRYRDGCFREGFRSLAIVPIRYQDKILGLIHMADERPGVVSDASLELIELMSPLMGEAIYRFATEEALKLSEEHYRSLIESSSDCIYQLTLDGEYLSMNTKMSGFLDIPGEDGFMGKQFVDQIVGNNEAALMAIGMAASGEISAVRYKALDRHDREIWWDAVLSPVEDANGKVISILGISRDITGRIKAEEELKLSHAQLRRLSAHLQSITEEERTKIAREVHDELGQVLTALKMDTVWLAKRLPEDHKDLIDKSGVMLGLIDSVIQSVKRICTELRPTLLDHLGISAAIEWQAEEFRKRTGLKYDLQLYMIYASKEVSTVLFRVLQEALTNINRHAEATKVRVMLREEDGNIVMRITDNGKGIKAEHLRKPQSFGLLGMRERVNGIGGTLVIRGLSRRGTSIKVTVPSGL